MPAEDLSEDSAQVAVFDNYSERYLGQSGWQATQATFGPYDVVREAGQARFVIGPEIVNQIEEFANVKLIVGTIRQDISWPDDVVPAPGAAKIGGILRAAKPETALKNTLEPQEDAPEPDGIPEPFPEPPLAPQDPVQDDEVGEQERKFGPLIGFLVMLLLAAGISYWFLFLQDKAVAPVARIAPAEGAGPCSAQTLSGVSGFDAQLVALRSCGSKTDADVALGLVEAAAAAGDPKALLVFGMVYDAGADVDVIEDKVGMTFGDVPATAAEYYARAVAAGSTEAADKLASLCARMVEMTDTLTQGAVTDYCKE